jgi:hypothetical protein
MAAIDLNTDSRITAQAKYVSAPLGSRDSTGGRVWTARTGAQAASGNTQLATNKLSG